MRTRFAAVLAAAALALPAVPPAGAAPVAPGFTSPNVEWLAQLPEAGAIGVKFLTDKSGKATYMYLTGVFGFAIYDVRNPELPVPMGRLPLPHFENEDVDGNNEVAIISTSPGGQIFLIDTRNKLAPVLLTTLQTDDGDAHTSSCIDDCKRYFYASEGSYLKVVDLKAALAGDDAKAIHNVKYDKWIGAVHDVDQDENGIVWMTGDIGGAAYATRPLKAGVSKAVRDKTAKASPRRPVVLSTMWQGSKNYGRGPEVNDFIMHNSKRPTGARYVQTKGKSTLARGGVFLTTEEDYLDDAAGDCRGAGRFHTWDATGSVEKGSPLRRLDTFTLKEGTVDATKGDKQRGAVFCGAHWFTVKDNIVAIGMYGAGTRFLDVSNPRDIKQVGFWFTADQLTWGAYFVPGSNVVYTVDVERGIDILKFTKPKPGTTYLAPAPVVTADAPIRFDVRPREESAFGYACPIVTPKRLP